MTIVEKAAYLKGLVEGLGIEPDSREGKLWGALNDLLSDMAHEIEDLQSSNLDLADAMDDMCEDLTMLEEMVDAYDVPDHSWDDEDDFFDDEDEDPDKIYDLDFSKEEDLDDVDEEEDEDYWDDLDDEDADFDFDEDESEEEDFDFNAFFDEANPTINDAGFSAGFVPDDEM